MKWNLPEQKDKNFVDFIYSTRKVSGDRVFFYPKIEDLESPLLIHNAEKAAKVIINAIEKKQKIYIHGDFDVDGITATSIMWNYLFRDLGANVLPHIPNRFTDGYGLNKETIEKIISEGGNLIISVDCGVKDIELVDKYADTIDFIITDHHTIREVSKSEARNKKSKKNNESLPEGSKLVGNYIISSRAKAVVHPKLGVGFNEYCGAGVSWKLCCAINELNVKKVDMSKYLDLVALGTVCDIMPLEDQNRTIVKLGIDKMRRTENIGIKALLQKADVLLSSITEYTLGFVIGPRLNASGRLESALDAVRLLTTTSEDFAKQLADKLNNLNLQRQGLTKEYLAIAEQDLLSQGEKKIYFLYGKEWPEGIVGLISGRLTEKYNRPTIVGSLLEDGNIKASARSIEGFHISNALKDTDKYLIRYGGHAQAAGLTLASTDYAKFMEALSSVADKHIKEKHLEKAINIDAVAKFDEINIENISKLLSLSPFGNSNPLPKIALLNVDISDFKTMGKDGSHIKIVFPEYGFEAVGFNLANEFNGLDSPLLDLAGSLEINTWNNKQTPFFKINHWRKS
ncbi:MAG: DHH family phosphoesterase, partial [Candidatus Dojkabacteria bacterium]